MSNTYGTMQGCKGQVTRTGHHEIWANLKTWNGSVDVTVYDNESAVINVNNLDITLNGNKMFAKLKVYGGSDHPHVAQNPELMEI